MSNVKAGDLAVIRCKCASLFVDNGKVVEVLRQANDGDPFPAGGVLRTEGNLSWWVRGTELHLIRQSRTLCGTNSEAPYRDVSLIPITPPAGTVTQREVLELYQPRRELEPTPCPLTKKERV